jgi:hypothetical protein
MTESTPARQRKLAMACHLAALLGVVIPSAFLIEVVGPLVVWLVNRDESRLVDEQGAEAVNFQVTMTALYLACIPLMLVIVGIPLFYTLKLLNLVLVIVAAVRVQRGEDFRYPFNLRLVRPREA